MSYSNSISILGERLPVEARQSAAKFHSYTSSYPSSYMSVPDSDVYDDDEYDELCSNDGYSTESSCQSSSDSDYFTLLKVKRNIKSELQKIALLPSTTPMDIKYYELAIRAIDVLIDSSNYRVIIAIGGTPGSGKSTLSEKVTEIINKCSQPASTTSSTNSHHQRLHNTPVQYPGSPNTGSEYFSSEPSAGSPPTLNPVTNLLVLGMLNDDIHTRHLPSHQDDFEEFELGLNVGDFNIKQSSSKPSTKSHSTSNANFATTVTMDGYHLTRAQLDQFEDPAEAHKRRGSPWTFDAEGVVSMAESLFNSCMSKTKYFDDCGSSSCESLYFPSFDHAVKDPTPNGINVAPTSRIIFLEGLYTLYSANPWNQIVSYVDDSWMIYVDLEVSTTRLAKRHLQAGIVDSLEAGIERVKVNDELNARLILNKHVAPKVIINSISL